MSGEPKSPATAPRKRRRIALRRTVDLGRRLWQRTYSPNRTYQRISYYPTVNDRDILADIVNRAAWYFRSMGPSSCSVKIPVSQDLLETDLSTLAPPAGQEAFRDGRSQIALTPATEAPGPDDDAVFLWRAGARLSPRLWTRRPVEIVDKNYFWSVESQLHARAGYWAINAKERQQLLDLSKTNFAALAKRVADYETAYVFGTGPSLSRAVEFEMGDSFKIVCNSAVKNRTVLRHIQPQLLVFADPVFHFSPCAYAAKWRELMLEAVHEFDLFVMTQEEFLPLLLAHFPSLDSRAIGIPNRRGDYNFPTTEQFFVRGSINIMTSLMLPVASSFARTIQIVGADGRSRDEKYFWRHDPTAQLGELMDSAVQTHPSFFRDRIYEDYYSEHNRYLDELLGYGETLGKSYYALTPSLIPALQERPALVR